MLNEAQHARLVKLLRMLSSTNDHEILAAVKGIERVLASAGLSLHELAEAFADQVVEVEKVRVQVVEKVVEVEKDPTGDWLDACGQLLETRGLAMHERGFVEDMQRRFTLRPGFQPSEKQTNWFVMLYKRAGLRPRVLHTA